MLTVFHYCDHFAGLRLFAQLSVRDDLSYRYIKVNNADQTFILFVFCPLQKGKQKCPCCLSLDITLKKTYI